MRLPELLDHVALWFMPLRRRVRARLLVRQLHPVEAAPVVLPKLGLVSTVRREGV